MVVKIESNFDKINFSTKHRCVDALKGSDYVFDNCTLVNATIETNDVTVTWGKIIDLFRAEDKPVYVAGKEAPVNFIEVDDENQLENLRFLSNIINEDLRQLADDAQAPILENKCVFILLNADILVKQKTNEIFTILNSISALCRILNYHLLFLGDIQGLPQSLISYCALHFIDTDHCSLKAL